MNGSVRQTPDILILKLIRQTTVLGTQIDDRMCRNVHLGSY